MTALLGLGWAKVVMLAGAVGAILLAVGGSVATLRRQGALEERAAATQAEVDATSDGLSDRVVSAALHIDFERAAS